MSKLPSVEQESEAVRHLYDAGTQEYDGITSEHRLRLDRRDRAIFEATKSACIQLAAPTGIVTGIPHGIAALDFEDVFEKDDDG